MEEAVPKDRETIVEEGIIQQESFYTEIEAKVLLTETVNLRAMRDNPFSLHTTP
jgi:hypothetical protein